MEIRELVEDQIEAARKFLFANGWSHRLSDVHRFRRLIEGSQHVVVATIDGEIVGFARGITDGISNGYLSMVAVAEGLRRRGIGRKLVERIVGGDRAITWVLRADRDGAAEFFSSIGFSNSSAAMELRRSEQTELNKSAQSGPPTVSAGLSR